MATASAKPATAQKKGKKVASDHPGYEEMIIEAVKALADKKGSSRQAIAKFIKKNFTVPENVEVRIKLALKRMEKKATLTHTKGSGASGSFKVTESKKPVKKPTKSPTKSPKKVKKPATAKKTAKPKTIKKKTAAKPSAAKPSAAKEKAKTASTSKKTTPSKKPSPASPKKAGSPKKASKTKKGSPKKGSKKGGKAAKK